MLRVVTQRSKRVALAWLLGLAALALGRVGRADGPSPQDRTTARELATEGYDALQVRDYALAADRFKRADALVHAPTLLVDLGRSYIGLGRLVEAYEVFQQVLREGVTADAPMSWHQALVAARAEAAALEPRLAWLTIRVEGAEAPRVKLDDQTLPQASLGTRRAVDPGQRSIVAEAEGFLPSEGSVDLSEGETEEVELVLEPDPNYRPPPPGEGKQVVVIKEAADSSPDRTPAYVAYGVGGAGLLLGGVSTTLMFMARSDLEDVCQGGECPKDSADDLSKYHTYGTLAAVGFGVALAGAGVGTYFLLSSQRKEEEKSFAVNAEIAPGYVGVRGRF